MKRKPATAATTPPSPPRAIRVGDSVQCTCEDPWLSGQIVRVIGLSVRSCQGFVGVAVQYSSRGYSVLKPGEFERMN